MNENVLVAVSCYAGDKQQVENNLSCYLHHGRPVWLMSPADSPVTGIAGVESYCAGKRGWIGPHTLERQRKFLEKLSQSSYKYFLFNDADSVCLSPRLPDYLFKHTDTFFSNEVTDTNPGPSQLPKIALQPPYFFSHAVVRALLRVASTPALSYTHVTAHGELPIPTDCIDHFLLQLVYAAGMRHESFPDGASWETASEVGLTQMKIHVGQLGKIFVHSIKTKQVLDTLMKAREGRA